MGSKPHFVDVLVVASEAGHILLENGAEISRVEDIMARISSYYGVDSGSFFVLSNGIFTTGQAEKIRSSGGQASTYANVAFIPIRGAQLAKVTAVNRLSYDISAGKYTLEQARARLEEIKAIPFKSAWAQVLASAFGAAGFSAVFGGGFLDCAAAFVVGFILYIFVLTVSGRYFSKIVAGVSNALLASLLCIAFWRIGFGSSLSNIIIGAVMPLIPGVPFVNGVRDLANSDYMAGLKRMTDAMLSFLCLALGVSLSFILDGTLFGGVIYLSGMSVNPETASLASQALAALIGTLAFAVLYGVDRQQYPAAGLIGIAGWLAYLICFRYAGMTAPVATAVAAFLVSLLGRIAAVPTRCPAQVFLLSGLFTLVPGGGIFWCTYYLTSGQMALSFQTGFMAIKVAIAIVLGIVLAMELPQRLFSGRRTATH